MERERDLQGKDGERVREKGEKEGRETRRGERGIDGERECE